MENINLIMSLISCARSVVYIISRENKHLNLVAITSFARIVLETTSKTKSMRLKLMHKLLAFKKFCKELFSYETL